MSGFPVILLQPLDVAHLEECCPQIVKYLGLPPGWRLLRAAGCEDVWFDPTLLVRYRGRPRGHCGKFFLMFSKYFVRSSFVRF